MARGRRLAITLLVGLSLLSFVSLGVWQIQRREAKLALIARVDARVHAPPVPPPPASRWAQIGREADEYRHVRVVGQYVQGRTVLVQAVSELGAGFWVLDPLRQTTGEVVLVNRGFVPEGRGNPPDLAGRPPAGLQTVNGLLRISEPGGGFLRANAPAQGRWHSRDVAAMAETLGLGSIAPYFIDEDAPVPAVSERWPAAGLTVVQFRNHHLIYALTWFGLAGLAAYGLVRIWRDPAAASPDPG